MSVFDAEIFAQIVTKDVCSVLKSAGIKPDSVEALKALSNDIEATFAALEIERDGRRARALRDDLVQFLPGRNMAVLEAVTATVRNQGFYCTSCSWNSMDRPCPEHGDPRKLKPPEIALKLAESLAFMTRVCMIVAESFVTGGGA